MIIELRDDAIVRDGTPIGRVEKRAGRWWWFVADAQGDEPSRAMVLSVVGIFLRGEEARSP